MKPLLIGSGVGLLIGVGLTVFCFSLAYFFAVNARATLSPKIREQMKMAAKRPEVQPWQVRSVAWELSSSVRKPGIPQPTAFFPENT